MPVEKENLIRLIEDDEKWGMAEWHVRLVWLSRLQKHSNRIREGTASQDDFDLFWVKFWGFIEEFAPAFADLAKHLERMDDPGGDFYNHLSVQDRKQTFETYQRLKPPLFPSIVAGLKAVSLKVDEIKGRFTKDELFLACDHRTHICHPVSSFYRLRVNKKGEMLEESRGESKAHIQSVLREQFQRFRHSDQRDQPNENAARYFVQKIPAEELASIQEEAVKAVIGLYPSLVLMAQAN